MRAVVNGQLVEIPNEAPSVKDMRDTASVRNGEMILEVSGGKARPVGDTEQVRSGSRYRSVPPIKQG